VLRVYVFVVLIQSEILAVRVTLSLPLRVERLSGHFHQVEVKSDVSAKKKEKEKRKKAKARGSEYSNKSFCVLFGAP
jgi:hypothetical protein